MRIQNPNLEIVILAANRLGPLCKELVFAGGCATGLLITDQAAPPVRYTIDVDVIVEITTRLDYYKLEEKLKERGFRPDMSEDAPLCRWVSEGVILDVMPTDASILGFGNKWYKAAIEHAELITLEDGTRINMVTAPYFLATKLEAFRGRGKDDYYGSHDMEDIVAVIDGRPSLIEEILHEDVDLTNYLAETFNSLMKDNSFIEAIPGYLPPDDASQARKGLIIERIKKIICIK